MSMMGDPQGTPQGDPGTGNEGQVDPDSLASPFLNNIPLEDREVVGKYIKDWDAGVTKKFQDIHGQYAPYKELGDPETLASAMQIQDLLNNQPEYLLQEIAKVLGYEVSQPGQQQQQLPGQQVPGQQQPGFPNPAQQQPGNVSPEFQQFQAQIAQQQQALEQMAQILIQKNEMEQQQEQDRQLEALMSDLKSKHGEFDEQFVLMQIAQGKSPDDAIKAFAETVGKYGGQFGGPKLPPGPPALNGGIVPSGSKSVAEMDSKETQNLVASIMKAATQG